MDNKQHRFVKEMDGSFSQIWQLGFDEWSRKFPDFLQKKAKEYEKLYNQCIYKMQECINNVYTKNKELDVIVKQYVESGRSIEEPTKLDKNWVKARVVKVEGINVDKFFRYANGKMNDEKQQMLGNIYG
jgi:hypothetical protein